MRAVSRIMLVVALVAVLVLVVGTGETGNPPQTPTVLTEPVEASLADLAWLAGSWYGQGLGGELEEHWTRPAGGTMLGMFRLLTAEGNTRLSEYIIIAQEGPHVRLRFKHYDNRFVPWEKGVPLTFHCIRLNGREAVFDSNVQTNPKRLTYQLVKPDRLRVTVHGEDNGEVTDGFVIDFRRAR